MENRCPARKRCCHSRGDASDSDNVHLIADLGPKQLTGSIYLYIRVYTRTVCTRVIDVIARDYVTDDGDDATVAVSMFVILGLDVN